MPRTGRVVAGAVIVYVAFAGWLLLGPHDEAVTKAVYGRLFLALGLVNVVLALLAARASGGRIRAAWLAMAAEMAAWVVAGLVTPYYALSREFPAPSLADALYLSFAPVSWGAFLLLPSRRSNRGQVRLILDTLIVGGSFFLISWLTLTRSVARSETESSGDLLVWLAYPVSDIVVMTIATLTLFRVRPELRAAVAFLVAARACVVVTDGAFISLQVVGPHTPFRPEYIDLVWTAGLLLFAVAFTVGGNVSLDDGRAATALPGWASLWLPYVPLAAAAVIVSVTPVPIVKEPPVLVTGLVLVAAVLVRQLLEAVANRRLLADVAEQAGRDPLTGLANRTRFNDRLDRALAGASADDGRPVTVIVLDLDGFKGVNDSLGHLAGDELLRLAARRIGDCVRDGDTVARIGGDEFAILLAAGGTEGGDRVAQRVLAAFEPPFSISGTDVSIRPSLGLAVSESAGRSADDLMMRADTAMYTAKRARGPADNVFDGELRAAIADGHLEVLYQPKCDLATGSIVGVEALVRWGHPGRGVLGPDILLPSVRRLGLTRPFTDFVVGRALEDAARWKKAGAEIQVAVNVCPRLVGDPGLPDRIGRDLSTRGLSPTILTVELTEDQELTDRAAARDVLNELRGRGMRVSVDDFGTGYSALSYLCDLPVDEVKLDRDLISQLTGNPRAAELAGAVITLAHTLGLTVVAEGVEDAATAEMLRGRGCDYAQGFYFSAPLRADDLLSAGLSRSSEAPRALNA